MIDRIRLIPTFFLATQSFAQATTYALTDQRNHFSKCIAKIAKTVLKQFRKIQNFFIQADFFPLILRVALWTSDAKKMPLPFFLFTTAANAVFCVVKVLEFRALELNGGAVKENVKRSALLRIASIGLNAVVLVALNLHTPVFLVMSGIGILSSSYSLYKNQGIQHLNVKKTVERQIPPVIEQTIRDSISNIANLFPPQQVHPQPYRPFSQLAMRIVPFNLQPFGESMADKVREEEDKLNRSLSPTMQAVKKELDELMHLVGASYPGVVQQKIDRLFRCFDQNLTPERAIFAKGQVNISVVLKSSLKIRSIEVEADLFAGSAQGSENTNCSICLEDKPDIRTCSNDHVFHKECLEEHISSLFDRFLSSEHYQFRMIHKDVHNKHGAFLRTERSYKIEKVAERRGQSDVSCPNCREGLFPNYTVTVIDSEYGEVPGEVIS